MKTKPTITTTFDVPAKVWSDDHRVVVKFDAAEWLRNASVEDLRTLDACGWGGDVGADRVALSMSGENDEIADFFTYLEVVNGNGLRGDTIGFEVEVDEDAALAWLETHRNIRRLLAIDD